MGKGSSKIWMFFLLAVVVADALVAGVNGQSGRSWQDDREYEGKGEGVFPPEGRSGGGRGGRQDYPPAGGRGGGGGWQGDKEHEGKGEGVFPPEGRRGGGGGGGSWQGDKEHEGKGEGVFPPEGGRGGGGGRQDYPPEGGRGAGGRGRIPRDTRRFILSDIKRVVATDAGGMRVVKGVGGRFSKSPMHIGFITMEPKSMFIPQYLDSSLIFFVERGEARVGSIYKDKFVEKDLKAGDLYRIQAGSTFYLVNSAQGQRLHIITSIDTAESSDWYSLEPFYIGGGTNPKSVLAGFDTQTIATALNVSHDVVDELFSSRQEGAIMYLNPSSQPQIEPSVWKRFLELKTLERKSQTNVVEKPKWSLRNYLISVLENKKGSSDDSLDSYNIFDQDPDFKNDYGSSIEVTGDDYEPLNLSDFGAYLVNLTAGAMMAPHVNPTATEYGIVLSGTGNVQVVFPNGTLAMDAEVNEGDVFWIPRFFPFCQVASRTSPFVFFGFSTSARSNKPQFLAGRGSVMQTMLSPEFAAVFGLSEQRLSEILNAQNQTTILPAVPASPGGGSEEIPGDEEAAEGGDMSEGEGTLLMKNMGSKMRLEKSSFAYNMAMGMD